MRWPIITANDYPCHARNEQKNENFRIVKRVGADRGVVFGQDSDAKWIVALKAAHDFIIEFANRHGTEDAAILFQKLAHGRDVILCSFIPDGRRRSTGVAPICRSRTRCVRIGIVRGGRVSTLRGGTGPTRGITALPGGP